MGRLTGRVFPPDCAIPAVMRRNSSNEADDGKSSLRKIMPYGLCPSRHKYINFSLSFAKGRFSLVRMKRLPNPGESAPMAPVNRARPLDDSNPLKGGVRVSRKFF